MPDTPPPDSPRKPTVFLSYASEDRRAAQTLRDALPSHGVEVWYDETDLAGGDAWDHKIRQQIRECDFFMPVISAQTEARHEGYFRREWRLGVERSLDMADDHLFLLPVVIDDTPQNGARVPEKFLSVQWTKVPGGQPNAAFETLCRRLLAGDVRPPPKAPRSHPPAGAAVSLSSVASVPSTPSADSAPPESAAASRPLPDFPVEVPGRRAHYVIEVVVWVAESTHILFWRLPRLWRVAITVWFIITLVHSVGHKSTRTVVVDPAAAQKLQRVAAGFENAGASALDQLSKQIAAVNGATAGAGSHPDPVLVIPFSAPSGDPEGRRLADTAFAQVYGVLAFSHHGRASMFKGTLPEHFDAGEALAQARTAKASYVIFGAVEGTGPAARLVVKLLDVEEGEERWAKEYAGPDVNPAAVAEETDAQVHKYEDGE